MLGKNIRAWIWLLGFAAGCGSKPPATQDPAVELRGVEVRVSLQAGSPVEDALNLRLAEWEARTGSTVTLVKTNVPDQQADLCVVNGHALASLAEVPAVPRHVLEDPALEYPQLPGLYRRNLVVRGNDTVALPLATDLVLLWYRADLFTDPAIVEEYRRATGRSLGVPETWSDYVRVARFFHRHAAVKFGCVEATDGSADGLRNFFVHCAAYVKGPNWSSFMIDSETGAPRLAAPGFVRGLCVWLEALEASPAADGAPIDAPTARRIFCDGQAAMLLDRLPPTIDLADRGAGRIADKIGVAPLPGAERLFDPRTGSAEELKQPNRCAHLATTGWYVTLGHTHNPQAVERLLLFLTEPAECHYLVRGARRGLLPIHAALLADPIQFPSYNLPAKTVARLFEIIDNTLAGENWAADLRSSLSADLERRLAAHLQAALAGKCSPQAALETANRDWQQIIEPQRNAFLREYRQSLGLPTLLDD